MADTLHKIIANRYQGRELPIALVLPGGDRLALSQTPELEIHARTLKGLRALAAPGMGMLARAYVRNDIDFSGTARRALAVADALVGNVVDGRQSLRARWRMWKHQHRPNRRNIAHHYDVSNAFYRMWLDQRMVYSCAYFHHADDSLDTAQAQKLDHICRKLRLARGETLLDIGCGWGGLILWAAENYGVKATGITLSQRQLEYVEDEIARRKLGDRVSVRLLDYLDLPEDVQYDKVASVGMFEHVGVARFARYFGKIFSVLKPGGFVLNHGITHDEEGWNKTLAAEFINRYVFPDGELDRVSNIQLGMERAGFEIHDVEGLRPHYALTLRHWVRSSIVRNSASFVGKCR